MHIKVKPLTMGYLVEYDDDKIPGKLKGYVEHTVRAVSDRKALVLVLGSLIVKEVNLSKTETICDVERG